MAFNKLSSIILVLFLLSYSTFTNAQGSPPSPNQTPSATSAQPSSQGNCPIDTLKMRVCANLLGLVHLGTPPLGSECCALIDGLVDLEAAACICIALKANVLGINLNIPIDLSLILGACQKSVPLEYKCV
ncbi:pEARLI1-like lipid transfer protein 3 [Vicia villosa]|uniref:pEARLI1-like lipid transfer protein 3 n=1 Tax=Vicia villosa TaxID=3911 RepID=UPI00273BB911|nr:pEARLI1-like lipid transfer protein 3 [Vicia villosa]